MILKLIPYLAISLLGSPDSANATDQAVVARVGESEVRAEDIKPILNALPVREQMALARDPAALNDFVRGIIIQQLVYKEALTKKWEQQPQVVAQLDRLRQQAITQSYLQALATPPQDFPSQVELQAAYDALKKNNALQVPKQYHLAQIYVECPKGAEKSVDEKAQSKLDAAVKAVKAGDFSDAAKSQSDDTNSAQRGGDLGFMAETQIQPEIRAALTGLSKGAVTDPIRLNDGWHIIRLIEVKEPYTATLDEVKVSLTNELRTQRAKAVSKAYLGKLLQHDPVTLNEIAVSKLLNTK